MLTISNVNMTAIKVSLLFLCALVLITESVDLFSKNKQKISVEVKYDSQRLNTTSWWRNAVFYQIYVRSFMDSDDDGNGDLRGIINKIDHFTDAGVDAICLTSIIVSPQIDKEDEVVDYRTIDPTYGSIKDFVELLRKAHNKNIRVIIDFVPNHSSDQHVWFNKSVNREEGYENYYVWRDGKINDDGSISPPNNWLSVFNGPMWEWNNIRKQFYLHQFSKQQPDLNLTNPRVLQEFKNIITYWLDVGVDGFRVTSVSHLIEDSKLRDEPENKYNILDPSTDYDALNHTYTKDQNGTYEIIYGLRQFIDNYTALYSGNERILIAEAATDLNHVVLYYGNADGSQLGAHISVNFWFQQLDRFVTPDEIILLIAPWKMSLPSIYPLNLLLGNDDSSRVATRGSPTRVDGFNMLISFLEGVMLSFMGEEIGQENGNVTCAQGRDPRAIVDCSTYAQKSRDFERTPFQWDSSTNAGFSSGITTWLPVGQNYEDINLAKQKTQQTSHFKVYQRLTRLRKLYGVDQSLSAGYLGEIDDQVLYIMRDFVPSDSNTAPYYVFIFNMGNHTVDLINDGGDIDIMASSANSFYTAGKIVKSRIVTFAPGDSLIVRPSVTPLLT